MQSFLDAIHGRVLVADGAMGTMLYGKGVFVNRSFDELNLTQPDLVAEVHQENVRAGADVIETNTFGANAVKLAPFGLVERLHSINVQGARIARHAARDRAYVAGAVGPLGIRVEPWGRTGLDEAEACFQEQARALLDGGVDLFIFETFRDVGELVAAITAVRAVCALPIVAQTTTDEEGNTLDGAAPEAFVPVLERAGADVIGLNCSVGPAGMLETLERMHGVSERPLSAQPNAGRPREIEGRNIYLSSPEYMASYARRFVRHGVKLVGGCCGTEPAHVEAIVRAVQAGGHAVAAPTIGASSVPDPGDEATAAPEPLARSDKSRLANRLDRGSFVVLAELLPPRGDRRDEIVEQAQRLKIRGVDAITVGDGPTQGGRMSALAAAIVIEQQAGIETVLQYECRDRGLLRMQSDLLGAHAIGLRNVMIVTGEPLPRSIASGPTTVVDVDSIGLTNVVVRLNHGLDIGGQPIGQATGFHVGVAVRPDAVQLDEEIRRFELKVDAGAEFAVTAPIFDIDAFDRWLARTAHLDVPVIARVHPLANLRDAEFLANEVPGTSVPAELLERMRQSTDPVAEGAAIARAIATELRGRVQGLQVELRSVTAEAAMSLIEELAGTAV